MSDEDVLKIYNDCAANDIDIWIDGGWCVDALLGEQTREHPDLDIAVARKHADKLKGLLLQRGYTEEARDDSTEWMYVMRNKGNKAIDVHVFEFNNQHQNIYGVEYPFDSLTGIGTIRSQNVNCIEPSWMFKFKTAYAPKEKDLNDVRRLSKKYGFELPSAYRA